MRNAALRSHRPLDSQVTPPSRGDPRAPREGPARIAVVNFDAGIAAALGILAAPAFDVRVIGHGHRYDLASIDLAVVDLRGLDRVGLAWLRWYTSQPAGAAIIVSDGVAAMPLELAAARGLSLIEAPVDYATLIEAIHRIAGRTNPTPARSRLRIVGLVLGQSHLAQLGLSVEELAAKVGLSRTYLSRAFRRATAMTIKEYLIRLRLEVAKDLLVNSTERISSIARRVGLYDASYLSRTLRRWVGVSPGAYRRTGGRVDVDAGAEVATVQPEGTNLMLRKPKRRGSIGR